ncbi:hypothetical protein PWT90_07280 [Aphanocladium album]|nr:hypothetical protein PWT90_07280 [Aphanocladium album]
MGDYHRYLERSYPGSTWTVDSIDSGCINNTIRVTETAGKAEAESFILKHARPFFGKPGRERKFSLKRQDIEEAILQLWEPSHPLHDCSAEFQWQLPRSVRHDQGTEQALGLTEATTEASVLLIEDLGPILDIYSCLEKWATEPNAEHLGDILTRTGETLGTSLANLHSHRTVEAIHAAPAIHETLSQSLTNELVWRVMVDPLPEYLTPLPDAEELCRRVTEDIKTPAARLSNVLCHGDFHNGNVMLATKLPGPGSAVTPIVVDWEFGHLQGRGVNGDAAEFTAGLHGHWIEVRAEDERLASLLQAVLRGFCQGYRQTAGLRCRPDAEDLNLQLLRSALLFHGAEMISCAHEYSAETKAFQELFAIGVWYLRRAEKDMVQFAEAGNLEKLREEDGGITSHNPDSAPSKALIAQGIEVVKADINDLDSVTAACKGSNIIFAVTDFYAPFQKVGPAKAKELETQQGIIMAKAAGATKKLEHYIWSTLPNGTKDFPVPHFEGKFNVNAFIKQDAALFAKTTFLIVCFTPTTYRLPRSAPTGSPTVNKYVQFTTYPPETPINFIGHVGNITPFFKGIVEKVDQTKNGTVVIGEVATLTAKEWVESWATAQGKAVQLMRVFRNDSNTLFPWPRWSEEFALMMNFFDNVPATEWIDPGTNVRMAQQLGITAVVTVEDWAKTWQLPDASESTIYRVLAQNYLTHEQIDIDLMY